MITRGPSPSRTQGSRIGRALPAACAALALLAGCKDATRPEVVLDCDTPGTVIADGREIPIAPNGFATAGNQIINGSDCQPFRFVGVSRPSLSFTPLGGRLAMDTAAAADFTRIKSWKANIVRIELAQYFWLPSSRFYDPGYEARADRVIKQARAQGLFVLVALQHSDRGDPSYPGDALSTNMHQPMADRAHSIPFWQDVAAKYKDDGGILFEVYSEPFPVGGAGGFANWEIWANGGTHPADDVYEPRKAFEAASMQELYNAVRGTGANNLVLISGTQWGYNLEGVPTRRVQGHNIVYATHPWSFENDRQPATWEKEWAFLAKTDPVMITEFGNYDCTLAYPKAVLDKADELGISWIAWAWQASSTRTDENPDSPICTFPMLLKDWGGTPSSLGQLVKDRLASY